MQNNNQRQPDIPVVAGIPDPILDGIANGWNVRESTEVADGSVIEADVIERTYGAQIRVIHDQGSEGAWPTATLHSAGGPDRRA